MCNVNERTFQIKIRKGTSLYTVLLLVDNVKMNEPTNNADVSKEQRMRIQYALQPVISMQTNAYGCIHAHTHMQIRARLRTHLLMSYCKARRRRWKPQQHGKQIATKHPSGLLQQAWHMSV